MVTDEQVRQLRKLLAREESLQRSAWKTGMDPKTARKYRSGMLPSERKAEQRVWRTRDDAFIEVWPEIQALLDEAPELEAKTLFAWLQREHPGKFQDGQLRTLQRRIKHWRATEGPPKEVFFSQSHHPGRLCASDFTSMNSLGITILNQTFEHMAYHFVLTYSNWEFVKVCFSESFESLSEGVQSALWQLGGVPENHRTDRLSAAVNNLTDRKEFTERYTGLSRHYNLKMEKTNPYSGNENGDAESLHRHFKKAVDQALMLRGSRDFGSREDYEAFLTELTRLKNRGRQKRLDEELEQLKPLPERRLESFRTITASVNSGSLVRVQGNTYSVNSRLIGETVSVRINADYLEVWYAQKCQEQLPRLRGDSKHCINYRHVIDWLVRKPGAFENYRYREDLFPTSRFRMAYDQLCENHTPLQATKRYLRILEFAAKNSEVAVDDALRILLKEERVIEYSEVERLAETTQPLAPATDVCVNEPDLTSFDELLNMEVYDAINEDDQIETYISFEGPAPADIPGVF